jgi:hypothetical protein
LGPWSSSPTLDGKKIVTRDSPGLVWRSADGSGSGSDLSLLTLGSRKVTPLIGLNTR